MLAIAIIANIAAFFWRSSTIDGSASSSPLARQSDVAQGKLSDWESLPLTGLGKDEIKVFTSSLGYSACNDQPTGSTPLSQEELTPAQASDLEVAILGLISAYADGSPESLLVYSKDRGETISDHYRNTLRQSLAANTEIEADATERLSDIELLHQFWKAFKVSPHWSNLLPPSAGCVSLWRTGIAPYSPESTEALGRQEAVPFANTTDYHHVFSPSSTALEELVNGKDIIIADVMFVVKHDEQMFDERSPYYIRFWYSVETESWHPLLMKHVPSLSGKSPNLVF
jgi:hypothetical protein